MSKVAAPQRQEPFILPTPFIPSFESTIIPRDEPIHQSVFLRKLVQQMRFHDTNGIYDHCPDSTLLQSLIIPAGTLCPVESARRYADPCAIAPLTRLQVSAFYHAIAAEVETITGQVTQIFINLGHSELSSALIFCGNLLVLSQLLRQVNCFGFESIETLKQEGEQMVKKAVTKAYQYFNL